MSALDHLKEYRVVQISLPRAGGEIDIVDGVALATDPPVIEVTFLPDQLQPATFDDQGGCRLSFTASNGTAQTLMTEVLRVVSDTKLQLRVLESSSHNQKRSHFRVDADIAVSYWPLDVDGVNARSAMKPVNLSGGGLRIPVKEELNEGTRVGLEIIIDEPRPRVIECIASVVRSFRMGGVLQLALNFIEIEEEDRDAIVAYCFAEQRKQLRMKVHLSGLGAQ